MQPNLFKVLGGVAGLAGISLGVFLLLNSRVLELGIFPGLSQAQAFAIIFALLVFTFGISGIAAIGWLLTKDTSRSGQPLPGSIGYILTTLFALIVIAAIFVGYQPAPPVPPPAPPPQPPGKTSFKLCFGEGGGNNCLSGADIKYGCNTYRAWSQKAWDDLANDLCGSKDKMTKVQTQNNGGGGCGWTAFNLTCTK
ncbi:hypothetical protein JQ629_06880 [Bradyrhizobium sp. AUGA SZCCT0222]|uniref:hypothetical protein n=1 Tax=Bradyrhizobium sp. AUGA SZCCT0222 TaxID=2807668 RepID=UPI001BA5B563|nr:hypothetical protein [Bradyrhizobium sp. AUGA SZCCT0222]MBR1267229.1 hypothetical protein [Bradyrhizobium sp. AUGA SZCCT0222]